MVKLLTGNISINPTKMIFSLLILFLLLLLYIVYMTQIEFYVNMNYLKLELLLKKWLVKITINILKKFDKNKYFMYYNKKHRISSMNKCAL
jgi:hypothetical protein